jgi:hypothetical protein
LGAREFALLAAAIALALLGPNANAVAAMRPLTRLNAACAAGLLAASFLALSQTSPFIYFNF